VIATILGMTTSRDIRSLFRIDAAFEAALGAVLILGGAVGWLTRADVPVGRGLIVGAGCSLIIAPVSTMLYFAPRAPRRVLVVLALGNVVMAAGAIVWLLAGHGFSALGASILAVFAAWKAAIGSLQLRPGLARRVAA
jgi:hypothetical protein